MLYSRFCRGNKNLKNQNFSSMKDCKDERHTHKNYSFIFLSNPITWIAKPAKFPPNLFSFIKLTFIHPVA